jgi:hypothetical protein
MDVKYYYADNFIGGWSEEEIKKYCKEFYSFDGIASELYAMKVAFNNETASNSIYIYTIPDILEVMDINVHCVLKRKLFSKVIKDKYFHISITQYYPVCDTHAVYDYKTTHFEEAESILRNFIENHKLPNLTAWQRTES